jgi:hypothetical protein
MSHTVEAGRLRFINADHIEITFNGYNSKTWFGPKTIGADSSKELSAQLLWGLIGV